MNNLVEKLNDFFATRPGLLPMIGILLVLLNLLLQIFPGPGSGWLVDSNLFLHIGVIVSVVGILLIRALS
ncbi:MAG: hypothetical protein KBE23_07930 [Chloroflexi bacterium]|nr:hypothetical protein [Chloroflexota bacterium]MBP7042659.1 hypothetical protein [Chloroflexota bacterium]